jgi:hypothetical protein
MMGRDTGVASGTVTPPSGRSTARGGSGGRLRAFTRAAAESGRNVCAAARAGSHAPPATTAVRSAQAARTTVESRDMVWVPDGGWTAAWGMPVLLTGR